MTIEPPMISGANHETSFQVSVKSSWAMWIQYSCGSLMKIQMKAAVSTQNFIWKRTVFQRERMPS